MPMYCVGSPCATSAEHFSTRPLGFFLCSVWHHEVSMGVTEWGILGQTSSLTNCWTHSPSSFWLLKANFPT